MKMKYWAAPVLAITMLLSGAAAEAQYYGPPPQRPDSYGPVQPWESAPREFRAAMQRGFRDGVEGARKDFQNHRPPNVRNRDEFRNPSFIAPADRHDYRMGFRRGYEVAMQHIYGGRGDRGDRGDRGNGYVPR